MKYRIITLLLVVLSAFGYSFYAKKNLESQIVTDSQSTSVLGKLPVGNFKTLDGQIVEVENILTKTPTDLLIVHFWGTWCAPCEAELPELLAFIKRFERQSGVKFLLVAADDEVVKVKKHLASLSLSQLPSIQWLIDNEGVHREAYGTTRVPETYVFSSDKKLLRKFMGPQDWNNTMFFQTFDEFVQISTRKL